MDPKPVLDQEVEVMPVDEADVYLEAWTPGDFDHFTDLGLLRALSGPQVTP